MTQRQVHPDVRIVDLNGDWQGLYIDGILRAEGHTLTLVDLLDALGVSVRQFAVEDEDAGGLPAEFSDLENWKEW